MASTTRKEGSYFLSILSGLAAGTCMMVTALMVRQLGESLGATQDGRQLLSVASVTVHLIGLVLMGLACGYFEKQRKPNGRRMFLGWSLGTFALMVLAGGYTMASIYGFVASERMSKQAALEQQFKDQIADKQAARDIAKRKLDAQLDMTKGMVDWAKKSVKTDDLGRRERKDMLEAAQKAITDVTKDGNAPHETASREIVMKPDAQAEGLSKVTGFSIEFVQNTLGMWLAFLLIALEMTLWPQTTRMWPRKVAVELIEDRREERPALGTAAGATLLSTPEPKALLLAPSQETPIEREPGPRMVEPAPKVIDTPSLEPETEAIPHRLILLPGADLWLAQMKFPILAPKSGNPEEWASYKVAGQCFACWLRAHNLLGKYSAGQIEDLWGRCCVAYHKKQIAWNQFKSHFEDPRRGVVSKKIRIDGQESPRPTRWEISSAEREIRKYAPHPKQEASPEGQRPLARASVSLEVAANENSPQIVRRKVGAIPAWIDLQQIEARQMKFMMQQNAMRSRKQRGNRVSRVGRLAA